MLLSSMLVMLCFTGSMDGQVAETVTHFAQHMLCTFHWSSFTFELLALQPPTLLAGQLWHVLLLATVLLDRLGLVHGNYGW